MSHICISLVLFFFLSGVIGRGGWQQQFGAQFDGVFDFRGIWVDVAVFWNDGTRNGACIVGSKR